MGRKGYKAKQYGGWVRSKNIQIAGWKWPVSSPEMDLPLPCKETRNLEGHQGAVRAARFNYDGNYCLTCGSDKLLKLWNPHKGTLLKTYSGHGYEVLDAVGSSDNSRVVSCGGDKTLVQWDVATGQIIRRFRGHTSVSVHRAMTTCINEGSQGNQIEHIWDHYVLLALTRLATSTWGFLYSIKYLHLPPCLYVVRHNWKPLQD